MDYSSRTEDPRRHWLGLSAVVLLHFLVIYALVNGLAKKVVDAVRSPIEIRLIEERPPPPPPLPPPPPEVVAPPKRVPPPPVYVPPPEVVVSTPELIAPTITATSVLPPLTPVDMTPVAPPAALETPVASRPAILAAGIACSRTPPPVAPNVSTEIKGSLFVIGTLKAGRVVQIDIDRNTLKGVPDRRTLRAFINAIEVAMKEGYVCTGDGVQIRQEFFFDIR